jgi:ankyrin repeat protein
VLLKAGADVNARNVIGWTPLMYASKYSNPELISILLKAGADVNAKNADGVTALDYAKDNEKLKGTQALKELEQATTP